jgi:hypothetical protein
MIKKTHTNKTANHGTIVLTYNSNEEKLRKIIGIIKLTRVLIKSESPKISVFFNTEYTIKKTSKKLKTGIKKLIAEMSTTILRLFLSPTTPDYKSHQG